MADRASPEKKAFHNVVQGVLDDLDDTACLCDAGELAALGLDEPSDRAAIKQLLRIIGDRVRAASQALAPNGTVAP